MNVYFTVSSSLEFYLTLLAWHMYDIIWYVIWEGGVGVIPFGFFVIGSFVQTREYGYDEGNKGRLFYNLLEVKFYTAFAVMAFCIVPMYTIEAKEMKILHTCSTQDYESESNKPSENYKSFKSDVDGQEVKVPFWFALVHTTSKALNAGAIATIPCKPDIRQTMYKFETLRINDVPLQKEMVDFTEQCFIPARNMAIADYERENGNNFYKLDDTSEYDWFGGSALLPYYQNNMIGADGKQGFNNGPLRYKNPSGHPRFYVKSNDIGTLTEKQIGQSGGFPSCYDWWSGKLDSVGGRDTSVSLRRHLLNEANKTLSGSESFWKTARSWYKWESQEETDNGVLKLLTSKEKVEFKDRFNSVDSNFKGDNLWDIFWNSGKGAATSVVAGIANLFLTPFFEITKTALPMLQFLVIAVVIIASPFVMTLGSYSFKTVMNITSLLFGLYMLTFWWEFVYYLDNNLLYALKESTENRALMLDLFSGNNFVFNMVMFTLYILIPGIWLGMISFAGYHISQVGGAIVTGANSVKSDSNKGLSTASSASKFKKM